MQEQRVHVIATQHLDVAWLWPRSPYGEELMRQCFERAIEMIEADPDQQFVFSRSTAWSFKIMEDRYPALFEKIRTHVANGQIELCGGEWVEPDHLLPDGESLIRQCALGQWYFLDKFGKCASVCWDPDIFGHPHSYPQIISKCGMEGYYSHRCRPRDENGEPFHQFIWEGPDGSRVFYLAGKWIGEPNEENIQSAISEHQNQDFPAIHVATGLMSDRRIKIKEDWLPLPKQAATALGLASCEWSSSDAVVKDMQTYADKLPVIHEEFSAIFTGTYTTNIYNKRTNRYTETLLQNAEKLATWAWLWGFSYPATQLTEAWRGHCINQFHDIICGCSVPDVHAEDRELWADVARRATYAEDEALAFLCERISLGLPERETDNEEILAVFNPLSWPRQSTIEVPLNEGESLYASKFEDETSLPVQISDTGKGRKALISTPETPGIGYELIHLYHFEEQPQNSTSPAQNFVLENAFVYAEFEATSGNINSLIDKITGEEFIAPEGQGNRFVFLEDAHGPMPAWSIKYTGHVMDSGHVNEIAFAESGPIRQTLRVKRTIQLDTDRPPAQIVQNIMLDNDSSTIVFKTSGDWQAAHVHAKVAFDLAFEPETEAAEVPYAVAERSTHRTSASTQPDADTAAEDQGQGRNNEDEDLDSYMHKWVDINNQDRGLLVLNNGLYGYDTVGSQFRLSLLRAPLDPSESEITGLGEFSITYGISPHQGEWRDIQAPKRGYEFNNPMLVRNVRDPYGSTKKLGNVWRDWWDMQSQASDIPVSKHFIEQVQSEGTMITAVKQAENAEDIILRLVEVYGKTDDVTLQCAAELSAIEETDMLERTSTASSTSPPSLMEDGKIAVQMHPWEIKTLKLVTG